MRNLKIKKGDMRGRKMFCENCGNELEENEKFCPYCGEPVIREPNKKPEKKEKHWKILI